MEEQWKPVVGYEGIYEVSNMGNVRSVKRIKKDTLGRVRCFPKKVLLPMKNYSGYMHVSLYNGGFKKCRVNRLVAEAFIDNPYNKPFVNHINSIRDDNRSENLEWCTAKENIAHAILSGNKIGVRGEASNLSKLKLSDVIEIRKSNLLLKELAKLYKVSVGTISMIKRGIIWAHQ